MNPIDLSADIEGLEKLRKQNSYWRNGATGILAIVVIWSVLTLNSSARGLALPGPTQDRFISTLQDGLKKTTVPQMEAMARLTFAELQPTIKVEFDKVNKRVPEVTKATLAELTTLQKNLPEQGSKVLDDQFSSIITERETKIKSMFPDTTLDQMAAFVNNLKTQGHDQILVVNKELLAGHQAKIQSIFASMQTIKVAEAAHIKNVDPNWEMGLSLLDVMRDDLASMRPDKPSSNPIASKGLPNNTKKEVKK